MQNRILVTSFSEVIFSSGRTNARLIVRIIHVQFLFLCVLLICNGIAGPKNAVFWYVLITLTMLVLTVGYRIARKSR
jgi:hypothetical protein